MHFLQNGSQAATRPAAKPLTGTPGYFTESGDNNVPSYPGADWFNHVIAEFQNALAEMGVTFDPQNDDHLAKAFALATKFLGNTLLLSSTSEIESGKFVDDGYVTVINRGFAVFRIKPIGSLIVNGETIIDAGNGKVAQMEDDFLSFVTSYSSLQSALNYAKSSNIKCMVLNENVTVSGNLTNKGACSIIGNGNINGLYRKRVAKISDPVSLAFNDLLPSKHLSRFANSIAPVVVIVGDSLGTIGGGNIPASATLFSRLKSKITSEYPDKNITFYDRSIGGETYFTAVGLPSSFPTWYTNQSLGWPTYVGGLNPDLIIFNFGMNDSYGLQSSALRLYQSYLDDTGIFPAGRPDVVYCTNLTPSLDSNIGDFGTEIGQSGRDFVAGYTRLYAKSIGAGLLDFHRQCTIVKDGYDPTDTSLKFIGEIAPSSGAVVAQTLCTDFKWDLELSLANNSNFAVKLGYQETIDTAGRGSFVVIGNFGGYFTADFYDTPNNIYAGLTSQVVVPAGTFSLSIEKKQNSVIILLDNNVVFLFDKVIAAGKDFYPQCGDATYSSGSISKASFYAGEYKTYKQSITNDDMWGESSSVVETKSPWGGNGANHPSCLGASAVYQPVLDNTSFFHLSDKSLAPVTFVNGWSQQVGFVQSSVVKNDNVVTIQFSMTPPSDNQQGVAFTIPSEFRPSEGLVANAVVMKAGSGTVTGQIKYTGDFEIYGGITGYCWGSFSYVI